MMMTMVIDLKRSKEATIGVEVGVVVEEDQVTHQCSYHALLSMKVRMLLMLVILVVEADPVPVQDLDHNHDHDPHRGQYQGQEVIINLTAQHEEDGEMIPQRVIDQDHDHQVDQMFLISIIINQHICHQQCLPACKRRTLACFSFLVCFILFVIQRLVQITLSFFK